MPNYLLKSPENKDEWERYLLFRWEMLRKPLGMSMDSLADSIEEESFHLMGIDEEGNVIASGRVHFNTSDEAQIRYMAVDDNFKRQGIGSEIVTELEKYALSKKAVTITLNARENAISFYLSLGYSEVCPYQSDTGIPHKTMKKDLIV
jgi:predicted GNAT family N-acyltransferase|tara:strand:+ start:309 stop:752 length:444 start_codon:yes stop_codon:yes gene_type:complete